VRGTQAYGSDGEEQHVAQDKNEASRGVVPTWGRRVAWAACEHGRRGDQRTGAVRGCARHCGAASQRIARPANFYLLSAYLKLINSKILY
jgi:hypothetical protein